MKTRIFFAAILIVILSTTIFAQGKAKKLPTKEEIQKTLDAKPAPAVPIPVKADSTQYKQYMKDLGDLQSTVQQLNQERVNYIGSYYSRLETLNERIAVVQRYLQIEKQKLEGKQNLNKTNEVKK